ncbi:MAG: SGNH/GDSL hydrolase family protein, partial [Planctomycetota bacterium]
QSPAPATYNLITDVGNDIMYQVPVPQIVEWLKRCLDRLHRDGASTIFLLLPTESLKGLGRTRYLMARTLFFPGRWLPHGDALARIQELQGQLRALAEEFGVTAVEPKREWYGMDPIHARLCLGPRIWQEVLCHWKPGVAAPPLSRRCPELMLTLKRLRPEKWWLLGFERRREQPAAKLKDGSTVALY